MHFKELVFHVLSFLVVISLDLYLLLVADTPNLIAYLIVVNGLYFVEFVYLLIYYFRMESGDWGNLVDSSFVDHEVVSIPMADGWEMDGLLLTQKGIDKQKVHPAVIIHHGYQGEKEYLSEFSIPLAMRGYIILAIDARGHGKSRKRKPGSAADDWYLSETTGIFSDFHRIVEYLMERPEVDGNKLAVIGHSMGGTVALSSGLLNEQIKLCIGISPIYSFSDFAQNPQNAKKLSEAWFNVKVIHITMNFKKLYAVEETFSPKFAFDKVPHEQVVEKIRILFCRDDALVVAETNFDKIIEHVNLPTTHYLGTNQGGHPFRGQETLFLERMISWLDDVLPLDPK